MLFCERKRNTLTVHLAGELDQRMAALVRDEVDGQLADTAVRRLVFELSGLEFMDSSGIGLIIGRYKLMSRRGGKVAVTGIGKSVDRIFRMAGLYQLVERMA